MTKGNLQQVNRHRQADAQRRAHFAKKAQAIIVKNQGANGGLRQVIGQRHLPDRGQHFKPFAPNRRKRQQAKCGHIGKGQQRRANPLRHSRQQQRPGQFDARERYDEGGIERISRQANEQSPEQQFAKEVPIGFQVLKISRLPK